MSNMKKVLSAVGAGEASEKADDSFTFTTKDGIRFHIRRVPPLLVSDAQTRIVKPIPPKVHIDDKEADEENPSDPAYIRALAEYEALVGDVGNSILLTRGASVEHVPDSIESVSSTDWAEDVKDFAGLDVPAEGRKRYLCWLKYVALTNVDDFMALLRKIVRVSGGTPEADVASATDNFRSLPPRDTSPQLRLIEEDGRGVGDNSDVGAPGTSS